MKKVLLLIAFLFSICEVYSQNNDPVPACSGEPFSINKLEYTSAAENLFYFASYPAGITGGNGDCLSGDCSTSTTINETLYNNTDNVLSVTYTFTRLVNYPSFSITKLIFPDSDGDGVCGEEDQCPNDPGKTAPGICGCGTPDTDSDGDGTPDCLDQCPNDPGKIASGICGCGTPDTDSDGDGTPDCLDQCPNDPNKTAPGICGCGTPDTDSDGDGTADCLDQCPNDPGKTAPGICGCGTPDTDSDGDGTPDCLDQCPNDPGKIASGICGCGTPDTDSDGDGTPDCLDQCPNDPNKTAPGICGCGTPDTDSDRDGTADCLDQCPNDPNKTAPGICGCGTPDTDSDGDGTPDCNDQCPNDPGKILAGACGCGVEDAGTDADSDGVDDACDPEFNVSTALDALKIKVIDYNPKKGVIKSLINQLNAAEEACANEDPTTAIGALTGFINHVESKRNKRDGFSDKEADALIAGATYLKTAIENGESDCSGDGAARMLPDLNLTLEGANEIILLGNYPNPFDGETVIRFRLPKEERVTLTVYDLFGREIAQLVNGQLPAGEHQATWRTTNQHSGIYIYRLQAGNFSVAKKMTLSN